MITKKTRLKFNSIYAAVDIGSSKIACIVGKNNSEDKMEILGCEYQTTKSVKKGLIIDSYNIEEEIKTVVNKVAKKTNTEISNIILNATVTNSKSNFLRGISEISGEQIDDLHIKSAINNSNLYTYNEEFESLHNVINNFDLDKEKKVNNPKNLFANQLAVNIYQVMVKKNYLKSIRGILSNLNLNVEYFVASPFASSLATLIKDEKELGAICIDLGSGITSVCIIENDNLVFADAISVGSSNITYDIVSGLTTSLESAERLKTLYGSVFSNPSDEHELIDVPIIGSDKNQFNQINRSQLNTIIKARVEETLELIRQKLKEHNLDKKLIRNLVLTGGGSLLEGIEEYAQIIFDSKTRISQPISIEGLDNKFNKPQFSQTVGLMIYEENNHKFNFLLKNKEKIEKKTIFKRFFAWLDQYI